MATILISGMATILIVDSDSVASGRVAAELASLGYDAVGAVTGAQGLEALRSSRVAAVLLEWDLPDMNGAEVLLRMRQYPPMPPVTAFIPWGNTDDMMEAMRLGVSGCVIKPVDRDELARAIHKMVRRTAEPIDVPLTTSDTGKFIASSRSMRRVQEAIRSAVETNDPVLIVGETGSGKDTTARLIHQCSRHSQGAFVTINCAAISRSEPDSELMGALQQAGATLFLDNIETLDLSIQSRILDSMDSGTFMAAGGEPAEANARVIAGTKQDLYALAAHGKFHKSLYWRLNAIVIELPPLRDRLADLIPLAEHFLVLASPGTPKRLSNEAAARILSHRWPGNLRELKNAMERLTVFTQTDTIAAADVYFLETSESARVQREAQDLETAVARLEATLIHNALRACHGNRVCAARRLNIRRQLLYAKMRRYGITASVARGQQSGDMPELNATRNYA
jgi:two-component system NtrC family response regulator